MKYRINTFLTIKPKLPKLFYILKISPKINRQFIIKDIKEKPNECFKKNFYNNCVILLQIILIVAFLYINYITIFIEKLNN